MTMGEYQKDLKHYEELEKTLTEKYNACRKLKQYLKNTDATIEKINKTGKGTLSVNADVLKSLYTTVYSQSRGGEQKWKGHLLLKLKTLN